jgi:hypothetical protein
MLLNGSPGIEIISIFPWTCHVRMSVPIANARLSSFRPGTSADPIPIGTFLRTICLSQHSDTLIMDNSILESWVHCRYPWLHQSTIRIRAGCIDLGELFPSVSSVILSDLSPCFNRLRDGFLHGQEIFLTQDHLGIEVRPCANIHLVMLVLLAARRLEWYSCQSR